MTSTKRFRLHPLAARPCPLAVLLQGCATDPNTGAQSIAGMKVSDDPCAKTATVVGGVLGAVAGAVVTSQFTKSTDARVLGGVAGGGIGAAIGYNMDQRRCALFAIAKEHNAEMNVTPVVVPKGDLPPAAAVAATPTSPASATPFSSGSDTTTAGLSVTLKDNGSQFASGSDQLMPEAEALFREMADQYSYAKQQAKLGAHVHATTTRPAVESLKTKRILLVGHTDDTGSTTENANLSERRAAAVARVFAAPRACLPANLYYQGAGETLPVGRQPHRGRPRRQSPGRDRRRDRRRRIPQVPRHRAARRWPTTAPATRRCPTRRRRRRGNAKGKKTPKASTGFVDFGGVPAATLTSAPDFAAGTTGGGPRPARATRPIVPTCNADRPRAANGVKSLATQKDLPMSDYVPGLYNTSWSDTVNGNLVGLTGVDVPRDGGAAGNKPTLLIWKNYNPKKKMPPADFQANPDVNIYRGSQAILYRVFVGGPMKCMDVWFPYTDTGESRNSNLFYDSAVAVREQLRVEVVEWWGHAVRRCVLLARWARGRVARAAVLLAGLALNASRAPGAPRPQRSCWLAQDASRWRAARAAELLGGLAQDASRVPAACAAELLGGLAQDASRMPAPALRRSRLTRAKRFARAGCPRCGVWLVGAGRFAQVECPRCATTGTHLAPCQTGA